MSGRRVTLGRGWLDAARAALERAAPGRVAGRGGRLEPVSGPRLYLSVEPDRLTLRRVAEPVGIHLGNSGGGPMSWPRLELRPVGAETGWPVSLLGEPKEPLRWEDGMLRSEAQVLRPPGREGQFEALLAPPGGSVEMDPGSRRQVSVTLERPEREGLLVHPPILEVPLAALPGLWEGQRLAIGAAWLFNAGAGPVSVEAIGSGAWLSVRPPELELGPWAAAGCVVYADGEQIPEELPCGEIEWRAGGSVAAHTSVISS